MMDAIAFVLSNQPTLIERHSDQVRVEIWSCLDHCRIYLPKKIKYKSSSPFNRVGRQYIYPSGFDTVNLAERKKVEISRSALGALSCRMTLSVHRRPGYAERQGARQCTDSASHHLPGRERRPVSLSLITSNICSPKWVFAYQPPLAFDPLKELSKVQ